LSFEVEPSGVNEDLARPCAAEEAARILACRKAEAVAGLHAGESSWVIGSDTVVALGEWPSQEILGKPTSEQDARRMLGMLSGSRHRVVTGVAVVSCSSPGEGSILSASERTWVSMRPIQSEEIEAYVASGEWRDKAGGYAIQENADTFVTRLEEGGFDNVVGLPLELTLDLLRKSGAFGG
jgi:septum formation protein